MKKTSRFWLVLIAICCCQFMVGCSDWDSPFNKTKENAVTAQSKIQVFLFELKNSGDDLKRIQTAQNLFSLLKENQDSSVLNHGTSKELLHYMKDKNDGVRYWIALSLSFFGAYADEIVPVLLTSLDDRAVEFSSLSSSDAILVTLKKIEPSWRKRSDVTKRVLERWSKD